MKNVLPIFALFISMPVVSAPDLMSYSLKDLLSIDITGATLSPEKWLMVPAAVSVFSHKDISRLGVESLNELCSLVPGFQSYRSSGSGLETPFSSRGRRVSFNSAEVYVLGNGSMSLDQVEVRS